MGKAVANGWKLAALGSPHAACLTAWQDGQHKPETQQPPQREAKAAANGTRETSVTTTLPFTKSPERLHIPSLGLETLSSFHSGG